jgi:hypothetical protein
MPEDNTETDRYILSWADLHGVDSHEDPGLSPAALRLAHEDGIGATNHKKTPVAEMMTGEESFTDPSRYIANRIGNRATN